MAKTLQHQIIARALALISDDSRWTGGAMARDARRHLCSVYASDAVRFCALGALARAAFELLGFSCDPDLIDKIEAAVLAANGLEQLSLASINDRAGREIIVAMFQKVVDGTASPCRC